MKLGDVLRKERERKTLSVEETAATMKVEQQVLQQLEAGESDAETWGPLLADLAIALETPVSRLLSESGRAKDCRPGQAGGLIAGHRRQREKSAAEVAELLEVSIEDYQAIEKGDSPIETVGPQLLAFAEVIEQPIFNLFYPCGLPFQELDDYP